MLRVVFVVLAPAGEGLHDRIAAGGSPFLYLQDLGAVLRERVSIFRSRPTDDFSSGLEAWLVQGLRRPDARACACAARVRRRVAGDH